MSCRRSGNVRTSKSWTVSCDSGDAELARRLAHLARERVRLEARRQRARRDRERDVAHLAPALDEPRHRPAAAELAVVRVRREHERLLPGLDHRAIQSLDRVTSSVMEHMQLAEIAALLGALGAVGVLIPRGGIFPLIGFVLLGAATGGLGWSLVGDDDVELLAQRPAGSRARRGRSRRPRSRARFRSRAIRPSSPSRCSPSLHSACPSSSATRRRSCSCRSTS